MVVQVHLVCLVCVIWSDKRDRSDKQENAADLRISRAEDCGGGEPFSILITG